MIQSSKKEYVMKKVENLSIDVKAFIKEEEIPFTTNPKGLDFLMGILAV